MPNLLIHVYIIVTSFLAHGLEYVIQTKSAGEPKVIANEC